MPRIRLTRGLCDDYRRWSFLYDVYAVAAGNVCIDLGTIGSLTIVGSLSETPRTITLADGTTGNATE